MNQKNLLFGALAAVAAYYWLSHSATGYQTAGINTLYSLGYNYGNTGKFSFTSVS